jgi:hypothetical protein
MSGLRRKTDLRSVPQMAFDPQFCRDLAARGAYVGSAHDLRRQLYPEVWSLCQATSSIVLASLSNVVQKYFAVTDCIALHKFV